MSIEEFKSLVTNKNGLARSNLYRIKLPALPGASSREVNLLCKNVELPGRQILTNPRVIGIRRENVPYGYAVNDVNMTFTLLNDYGIKNYFETWQSRAVNQTQYEVGYREDYGFNIQIEQLEKGLGNVPFFSTNIGFVNFALNFFVGAPAVYTCTLIKAFPTTMNSISLSNDLDGLSELTVTLSYIDWRPGVVSGASTNSSTASSLLNTGLTLLNRSINLPLGDFGLQSNIQPKNLPTGLPNLFKLFL